jgi:Resolvase, N terminal domain
MQARRRDNSSKITPLPALSARFYRVAIAFVTALRGPSAVHSGATLVRPGLEALRDLAAQGCLDVVLVYSPDRLARKFAYQALLLEEFARAGSGGIRQGAARRHPRGPAAGPVPGHLRRVRESPADRAVPARASPSAPAPGR